MGEDAAQRRAELAAFHARAQRRRDEEDSAKARVLLDRFVERATRAGLPTEELTARPWTGRGSYRTGLVGWYLRRDGAIGVDTDGRFYVLVVPPVRFGRVRTVRVQPAPPPLDAGRGGRDGEAADLPTLLEERLHWPGPLSG
jgi:hypothetical protein